MKNNHLKSISSYVSYVIIIGLVSLIVISFLLVIVFGLNHEFNSKKKQAEGYASIIAQTASMPYGLGVELYTRQIIDIISHDATIPKIDFFEIKNNFEKDNGNSSIWTGLTENSYSVHRNVVHDISTNIDSIEQIMGMQTQKKVFDDDLVGFVSVIIDVKLLREQWFAKNFYFLLSLVGFQLVVCILLVNMVMKTKKQSFDILNTSKLIIENDDVSSIVSLQEDVEFIELLKIRQAFTKLIDKNRSITDSFQQLKATSEKNRELDERLTRQLNQLQHLIDHEFKSSLNSIVGGVQLLSQQYLSEEQNDALSVIRKGGQLLDFILEQISQLNEIEKGQIKINQVEFNPLQLISDIVAEYQMITDEKNIELISDISHMDYALSGDIDKVRNIFQIIMDNAIKYTEKGSVTIVSNLQHFDRITRWTICIKDTGIGIPEQYHEDVFAPFFQVENAINNEHNGVGVGLTLARQLSEVLDARLTLESSPEAGTSVEFMVPLLEKSQKFDRRLLKKKNIACFYSNHNINNDLSQLVDFGAKSVHFYQNIDDVIGVLNDKHIDVLIIATDVNDDVANRVVKKYRLAEKNHRSLIIRLYQNNDERVQEDLMEAVGIDLVIFLPYLLKDIAMTIDEWLR